MLPEKVQGTSGRSRVFKTRWPVMGARGAQRVQSIAKAINGPAALEKEIIALQRVRYDHPVLSTTSVESHHLRLGN